MLRSFFVGIVAATIAFASPADAAVKKAPKSLHVAQLSLTGAGGSPKVSGGGGGSITWTPGVTTAWQNVSFSTTATFHPNNSVAPPANSLFCVFFATVAGTSSTSGAGPMTFTIDGTTPTIFASDSGTPTAAQLLLMCVNKSSYASDAVAISGPNNFSWEGVSGGYFQNFTSSTPTATSPCGSGVFNTNPVTITTCGGSNTTLTVPSSGIGIAGAWSNAGTAGSACATFTWQTSSSSNITSASGDANNTCEVTTPTVLAPAHTVTAGTWGPNISFTPTPGFDSFMIAATFH